MRHTALSAVLLAFGAHTVACGHDPSPPRADADRSGDMETLPRPIEIVREHPDAGEEFAEPVTDLRGFRVKPTGAEQQLSVKFKDVDDAVRTKAFVLQPGGYYVQTGDQVTVRPRSR